MHKIYVAFALTALLISALPIAGQDAFLSISDLLTLPSFPAFYNFAVSPDGTRVAYMVQTVRKNEIDKSPDVPSGGVDRPSYDSDVWVTNLRTGESRKICCEDASALTPTWSPDGRYLAFYKGPDFPGVDREKLTVFMRGASLAIWDVHSSMIREFFKGQLANASAGLPPLWLQKAQSIAVLIHSHMSEDTERSRSLESAGGRSTLIGQDQRSAGIKVSLSQRDSKASMSAENSVDEEQRHIQDFLKGDLVILDLNKGETKIVQEGVYPYRWGLSPESNYLVYSNYKGQKANSFFLTEDICVVDLRTLYKDTVYTGNVMYPGGSKSPFTWSKGERFLSFPEEHEMNKDGSRPIEFIVLDVKNKVSFRLGGSPPGGGMGLDPRAVWSADDEYISFVRGTSVETWSIESRQCVSKISIPGKYIWEIVSTADGHNSRMVGNEYALIVTTVDAESHKAGFWRVWPSQRKTESLVEGDNSFPPTNIYEELIAGGNRILFTWESARVPTELYGADVNFRNIRRLTHLGSKFEHVAMGFPRIITWKDDEGRELKGVLLLPPGGESGGPYPLIVNVYPGEDALWTINLFGCSAFSGPFYNWQVFATRGYAIFLPNIPVTASSVMSDIGKRVLPGIQKLVETRIADRNRIGVTGMSAGGFATLALIAQSNLFKAAVVVSGFGDLVGEHASDYGRRVLEESWGFHSAPWDNRELYVENSPIFYLNRITAPILITHGTTDSIVPVHLGREVFGGLRELGKEASYVEYEGEGHDPNFYSPPHQLDLVNRMIRWFHDYLRF